MLFHVVLGMAFASFYFVSLGGKNRSEPIYKTKRKPSLNPAPVVVLVVQHRIIRFEILFMKNQHLNRS